jgi:heme exporter protein D
MQWGSVAEFLAMGGYGLYVWPSFGVAALCMGGEILAVWRRHAAALESHHDES